MKRRVSGGDPNFASVALLLHFDGTNGQTTTTDTSGAPHTMALSSAQLSSAQAKFGTTSLSVSSGTSGSANLTATVSPPDNLQFGSSEWTIEFWMYPTTLTSSYIFNFASSNSGSVPIVAILRSDHIEFNGYNTSNVNVMGLNTSTGSVTANVWQFVQLRRRNGVSGQDKLECAVNGTQVLSANIGTSSGSVLYQTNAVTIGGTGGSTLPMPGYIDEFRVTNGVARAFNLPGSAFPDF
jgi:hypothetical protein